MPKCKCENSHKHWEKWHFLKGSILSVAALMSGHGVLRNLPDALQDLNLGAVVEPFHVLSGFLDEFNVPVHSITTSSAASISSSVMPSSRIRLSIGVAGAALFARRSIASRSSR